MDIGKAFSFVFDDEQWASSILICGLLLLVPILGALLLIGYMMETARSVAMGSPRPLPKWNNFGEKLSLGFAGFVISLVYALPLALIGVAFACIGALLGGSSGDSDTAGALFGSVILCLVPLLMLLALLIQPVILAATARYLQTGSLSSAFQVGEVIGMVRGDLSGWLVLFLLYLLCSVVGSLGSVIIIGFIFTLPYSQAVFGHLLGQKLMQLSRPAGFGAGYPPPPAPMM
ncbi:MAG: DUF4013 domain-containing protein [Chloroflexales bacterium]|nr:DUF4013 domain-containing protein [Chloroflexales bacterium]